MASTHRFCLDEHVGDAIAEALRRRGIDVVTTREAGLASEPDDVLLTFALQEGRVIVTRDQDFLRLHAKNFRHAGIAFIPSDRKTGDIVRGLVLMHEVLDSDTMIRQVEFL